MSDERDEMRADITALRARLVAVTRRWETLYNEKCKECDELRAAVSLTEGDADASA